uniref:VWFA domain-containing protein n=1 Tax=Oryzias latipes TaxID=8090 RepID=A0A3P9I2W2_ORYLA
TCNRYCWTLLQFLFISIEKNLNDLSGDLVFLIDSSGSIYPQDYEKMKDFMKFVISRSFIGRNEVHVGVLQFSSSPQPEFDLRSFFSKEEMLQAIDGMQQLGGGTLTGDALTAVSQYFDSALGGRPHLQQRLVVVTDGQAQDEVRGPAEALREKGVKIYAIGVVDANTTQLLEISGSHDRMYSGRDFDALKDLESLLALQLCDPERGEVPKHTCAGSVVSGVTLYCRPAPGEVVFGFLQEIDGFYGFAVCEKQQADLVFLVDQSGSIQTGDYDLMKNFTTELVKSFSIGQKLVRVGLAQFSSSFQHEFYLNQFSEDTEVSEHILDMIQTGGGTNIGLALKSIREYFETSRGSRRSEGISQNLVLITDGESQDDVEDPADDLRALGIEIFAIGIGDVHDLELLQITGTPQRLFTVQNFGIMALSLSESTSFNRAMLGSFREKFEAQSQAGVKVRRCCGRVLLNRFSYEQRLQAFSLFANCSQASLTLKDGSNDELYKL